MRKAALEVHPKIKLSGRLMIGVRDEVRDRKCSAVPSSIDLQVVNMTLHRLCDVLPTTVNSILFPVRGPFIGRRMLEELSK